MKSDNQSARDDIWYTNPMVWMIILLPATVVVASIITIVIAVKTDDGLVVDNYYKRGKEINMDLRDDKNASALGLRAFVEINARSGEVAVSLSSRQSLESPSDIRLSLIHRTRSGLDQVTTLTRIDEQAAEYAGFLRPPVIEGRWTVEVKSDEFGWRLRQPLTTKSAEHIILNITS